jgi:hypothetical protein
MLEISLLKAVPFAGLESLPSLAAEKSLEKRIFLDPLLPSLLCGCLGAAVVGAEVVPVPVVVVG